MRQAAESFTTGDLPRILGQFPEDVVWYSPGKSALAGTFRGKQSLEGFFRARYERGGSTIRVDVKDVLASDGHVVIFLRMTAERKGARLNALVAHFATVGPRGFARNWFLPDNVPAWDRFFRVRAARRPFLRTCRHSVRACLTPT